MLYLNASLQKIKIYCYSHLVFSPSMSEMLCEKYDNMPAGSSTLDAKLNRAAGVIILIALFSSYMFQFTFQLLSDGSHSDECWTKKAFQYA